MFIVVFVICLVLLVCGYVDYNNVLCGEFSGNLFVMWVGEGGVFGDGKFLFVFDFGNLLSFILFGDDGKLLCIQLQMMYIDGGLILKIGQVFNGFGLWGYVFVYMIYDWLYVVWYCNLDGMLIGFEVGMVVISFQ